MKVHRLSKLSLIISLLFLFLSCSDTTSANGGDPIDTVPVSNFVSAEWLASNIDASNLVIVDCRGAEAYGAGHIPGAVVTTWQNFANVGVATTEIGFGELLSAVEVGQKIAALGISQDDIVVTYAAANMGWGEAGRVAWMLQMAGIKVKVLEGGIAAWTGTKETTVQTPTASSFALTALDASKTISTTDLNASSASVVILDTRSKAEFDGDTTQYGGLDNFTHGGWGEKAFGHVPGAIHAPFSDLFETTGMLKSDADLEALVASWGLTDKSATIIPYCTGGIRSGYMFMVLQKLGFTNIKNYDASFYGWSAADMAITAPITTVPTSNFVDAAWLAANIDASNLVIVDCRGADAYGAGHIPGAVVTTWQNFANVGVATTEVGFGELLSAAEVGQKVAALGISKDDIVVTYAAANMGWGEAGRVAWMLQMAGIKVKVLEGGIAAWTGTKETTVQTPTASSFTLTALDASKTISTTDLNASSASVVILDTRSKAEFDGDTTQYGGLDNFTHGGWGEKAFGHVPGAIHAPFSDLFEATGMLKSDADLQALVTSWGLTDKAATIVPYCTGGIRSGYMFMVLQDLGFTNVKNYDASFYGWTAADMTIE